MEQFEAQMKKITEADESYSAEKLRALLREANEVIRDQLSLLQTQNKHYVAARQTG